MRQRYELELELGLELMLELELMLRILTRHSRMRSRCCRRSCRRHHRKRSLDLHWQLRNEIYLQAILPAPRSDVKSHHHLSSSAGWESSHSHHEVGSTSPLPTWRLPYGRAFV